jgi:hypothetical protein
MVKVTRMRRGISGAPLPGLCRWLLRMARRGEGESAVLLSHGRRFAGFFLHPARAALPSILTTDTASASVSLQGTNPPPLEHFHFSASQGHDADYLRRVHRPWWVSGAAIALLCPLHFSAFEGTRGMSLCIGNQSLPRPAGNTQFLPVWRTAPIVVGY